MQFQQDFQTASCLSCCTAANSERKAFARRSRRCTQMKTFSFPYLRQFASICGQFRIRLRRAALYCNPSESRVFGNILPRMARMARISFEQKGTKETKEEFFFVAFVCFCANSVPWAPRPEDSESVKSVKSVVQFLWLWLAVLRGLRLFAANQLKRLSMNHLHVELSFLGQGQSSLIKPNQVIFCLSIRPRSTMNPADEGKRDSGGAAAPPCRKLTGAFHRVAQ